MAGGDMSGTSKGLIVRYKSVECAGRPLRDYLKRSRWSSPGGSGAVTKEQEKVTVFEEEDLGFLRSLDPADWRNQDHYAVLGLKGERHEATFSTVKAAYRQKVLSHHPDKRKQRGERVDKDNDYFTCISKAWEILGDEKKRRSYDSVDSHFNNSVPSKKDINKSNFYDVLGRAFKYNSRWSEKKPVPELGGPDATKDEVNRFYTFWFDYKSWREYSYLDTESKESGQDREERKMIEKENRGKRAKLKKEENSRIRSLVEMAYNLDPRVTKFKQEEKDEKEAQKKARLEAVRSRLEEEQRLKKEEEERVRKEKEEIEAEERRKLNSLKAQREAVKKKVRKERKTLRDLCKENNYFLNDGEEELVLRMELVEKLCAILELKDLEELNKELKEGGKRAFMERVMGLKSKQEEATKYDPPWRASPIPGESQVLWSKSKIDQLVNGLKAFPPGVSNRWERVASFLNKNCGTTMSINEVLVKAKELQKKQSSDCIPSENNSENLLWQSDTTSWTTEEQELLEQALKTYPRGSPNRWERISSCIPSKNKKECMKRFKELVNTVQTKKISRPTNNLTRY